MAQATPSPINLVNDEEKKPRHYEEVVEDDVDSSDVVSDGDDALKLAGSHAHHFDEKYYLRLRRKIVSHLELIELNMAIH